MSASRARTTESRLRPSTPPAGAVPSALRAELESVWSISASDGVGAGVDSVLTYAGNVLQQQAVEPDALVALVAEIAGLSEPAARRALFRHAVRRLVLG